MPARFKVRAEGPPPQPPRLRGQPPCPARAAVPQRREGDGRRGRQRGCIAVTDGEPKSSEAGRTGGLNVSHWSRLSSPAPAAPWPLGGGKPAAPALEEGKEQAAAAREERGGASERRA